MDRRFRWVAIAAAAAVAAACLLGWWLLRADPQPTARVPADPPSSPSSPSAAITIHSAPPVEGECTRAATRPFTPERITIDGVADNVAVVGVPRDDRGVTGVLPVSDKVDVAWDLGGTRPGSRRGNVLLNTHTWPDGSALGNALLADLERGDRIVLRGHHALLCYRVRQRIEVAVTDAYPPYYAAKGPPQVAIIVCSGRRTGPGEWSHRTIWFARAITQG